MILDFGYFRLARRAAMESICYPKVGAVLSNRRPLSFGYNKPKTHPLYSNPLNTYKTTIHAEMDCLRFLRFSDVEGATVWVYRENRQGFPALAKPCDDCLTILVNCGIKKIIYTIDDFPYFMIERLR